MKTPTIIHTSDIHIGANRRLPNYLSRYESMLNEIVMICQREKADLLLIVGDIFDRKNVTEEERRLVLRWLLTLDDLNLKTLLCNGNHDELDPRSSTVSIFKILEFSKRFNNIKIVDINHELISYKGLDLDIACVPNIRHKNFKSIVFKLLEQSQATYKVLASHGMCKGAIDKHFNGSNFKFEDGQVLKKQVLKHFSYIALGDIHTFQKIGLRTYYSGSPIQHNFGESLPKGVLKVKIGNKPKLIELKKPKKLITLTSPPKDGIWPKGYILLICKKSKIPKDLPDNVITKPEANKKNLREEVRNCLMKNQIEEYVEQFLKMKGVTGEKNKNLFTKLLTRFKNEAGV